MSEDDPLEDLYVDETEINRERLSNALTGLLGIDRDSGEAIILSGFSELGQKQKIFAYLLYRRAAAELDHIEDEDIGMSSGDISDETGVPDGSVRSYCSQSNLIRTEEAMGGYYIPSFAITEAIDSIEEE